MDLADLVDRLQHDAGIDAVGKYGAVARITDPEEATRHLLACIGHSRRHRPALSFCDSLKIERTKIGYLAGALPYADRARVESLYHCVHPFAGPVKPSHQQRHVQLSGTFDAMCRVWDTQPLGSRSFGPHRQPIWDAAFFARAQADPGARSKTKPPVRLRGSDNISRCCDSDRPMRRSRPCHPS